MASRKSSPAVHSSAGDAGLTGGKRARWVTAGHHALGGRDLAVVAKVGPRRDEQRALEKGKPEQKGSKGLFVKALPGQDLKKTATATDLSFPMPLSLLLSLFPFRPFPRPDLSFSSQWHCRPGVPACFGSPLTAGLAAQGPGLGPEQGLRFEAPPDSGLTG